MYNSTIKRDRQLHLHVRQPSRCNFGICFRKAIKSWVRKNQLPCEMAVVANGSTKITGYTPCGKTVPSIRIRETIFLPTITSPVWLHGYFLLDEESEPVLGVAHSRPDTNVLRFQIWKIFSNRDSQMKFPFSYTHFIEFFRYFYRSIYKERRILIEHFQETTIRILQNAIKYTLF